MATIYEVIQFDYECPPSLAHFTTREAAEEFIAVIRARFQSEELAKAKVDMDAASEQWGFSIGDEGEDDTYKQYNDAAAAYHELLRELSGGISMDDPADNDLDIIEHELHFSLEEWGLYAEK